MTSHETTRLLVVRHRQSTYNARGLWAGQADPDLSTAGVAEAGQMGVALAGLAFDAIVTSDLLRARRTGQIVGRSHADTPLVEDPRLRELDAPEFSGLTRAEIEDRFPGALDSWRDGSTLDLPGAERWAGFAVRVLAGLRAAAGRGACTLVVAHAGALRVLDTELDPVPDAPRGKVGRSKGIWVECAGDGGLRVSALQPLYPEDRTD